MSDTSALAEAIFEGRQVDNNASQKLAALLAQWSSKTNFKIAGINNNSDNFFGRIQEAKQVFHEFDGLRSLKSLLTPIENYFEKSSELSTLLKERGNVLYKDRNIDGALRAYTLALAFAPSSQHTDIDRLRVPEELLLAYTNRSAVLVQKGLFGEALSDIQRALHIISYFQYTGNPNLQEKLREREARCKEEITLMQCSSKNLQKLLQVKNPSKKIPSAEAFVEIKYSCTRGRHLIVTRDVEAGSVLLVDQPFVSVLDDLLKWGIHHCHQCYRKMTNGVPCEECSFAFFCDEECRNLACKALHGIHRLEHKILTILHFLDLSHGEIQCLRIFAKVSKEELLEISRQTHISSNGAGGFEGLNEKGVYDTTSYRPIFHLLAHPPPAAENGNDEGVKNGLKALVFKEILKAYSNYFENSSEMFEDLVATIILKHMEGFKYNAISQSELLPMRGEQISAVAYACAIFPLISLCNHSCDPNSSPVRHPQNLKTSLVALKHIRAGDELCITYKPLYTDMKTRERQAYLATRYKFICTCEACENNFGPDKLLDMQAFVVLQRSSCSKCKQTQIPDFFNDKSRDRRRCHDCTLIDLERANRIREIETILFQCHDVLLDRKHQENGELVDRFRINDCLELLSKIVDYFGVEGFPTHFPLYNVALDLFKRALLRSVEVS